MCLYQRREFPVDEPGLLVRTKHFGWDAGNSAPFCVAPPDVGYRDVRHRFYVHSSILKMALSIKATEPQSGHAAGVTEDVTFVDYGPDSAVDTVA